LAPVASLVSVHRLIARLGLVVLAY